MKLFFSDEQTNFGVKGLIKFTEPLVQRILPLIEQTLSIPDSPFSEIYFKVILKLSIFFPHSKD